MNRKRTALIISLLCLLTFQASADDITLTYRQMKGFRVLGVSLSSPDIFYRFQIRQSNDGSFSVESPPFLVADIGGRVRVGEIRDSRLFTLMIDPFSRTVRDLDFSLGSNFIKIKSPSISPTLSGIALSRGGVDLIALSPMFNPRSPTGFGAIVQRDNFFAGFMSAGQNDRRRKELKQGFQQDWTALGIGRDMFFLLLGGHEEFETKTFLCRVTGAFQLAYDRLLGGGSVILYSLVVEKGSLKARFHRGIGEGGVQLKELESRENPNRTLGFGLQTGMEDIGLSFEYGSETFETPIYGGQSQRRGIMYTVGARFKGLEMKASNIVEYEKDRGKVQSTVYSADAKALGATVAAKVTMNRRRDPYLSDAKLEFSDAHAKLALGNGKALLELSWSYEREDISIKLSVNQDRRLTASMRLKGI